MLALALARFYSHDNVIWLPVLWITSWCTQNGSVAVVIDEQPDTPCLNYIDSLAAGRKRWWAAGGPGGDEVCRLRLPCSSVKLWSWVMSACWLSQGVHSSEASLSNRGWETRLQLGIRGSRDQHDGCLRRPGSVTPGRRSLASCAQCIMVSGMTVASLI